MMKEKNEKGSGGKATPVHCYACGQEGHISPNCPKKNVTNKTVTHEEQVSGESMMSKATAGMSDEQLTFFANELIRLKADQEKQQ